MTIISTFFSHFIDVFLQSAPWLLLGFFVAGIVKVMIPKKMLHRHLGGDSAKAVVKGAILGAPIPLCSCGVIPAALGLRRSGASKAATTSFLIATPETGVDSVSITYALLGPMVAIIRPIAAVTTAIVAGLAVLRWGTVHQSATVKSPSAATQQNVACCASGNKQEVVTSCCDHKKQAAQASSGCPEKPQAAEVSCCDGKTATVATTVSPLMAMVTQLQAGLQFTFVDLIKDTVLWLLLGLTMAAVIMTFVPAAFIQQWGASHYAYIVMALIGVPMYICATASTPIAAGLLFAGVSPGAILVFLLIGPATNIATIAMVKKELGSRILWIYLTSIVAIGFTFGHLTDWLSQLIGVGLVSQVAHIHATQPDPLTIACGIVLAILLANGLRQRFI